MNKIILGHAKTKLPDLPAESVNCVVTSPPYWGLRDYGIEPVIWDECVQVGCEHEWGNKHNQTITKQTCYETGRASGNAFAPGKKLTKATNGKVSQGQFCIHCNAWRGSLGLEPTFELYIKHLCDIFDEVKRVLRKDGTCWVNLGDSYLAQQGKGFPGTGQVNIPEKDKNAGLNIKRPKSIPAKSLALIPQRFAIEMVNRGWILRNTIIWHKPNCMPSSAKDRFTVDFEYVYFFVKSKKYWFEQQFENSLNPEDDVRRLIKANQYSANRQGGNSAFVGKDRNEDKVRDRMAQGRNKRAVWTVPTKPFPEAHFAVYPEALIEPMIQAGCPKDGIVLDPFIGAGTTAVVAKKQGKQYIGIEIKQEYIDMANKRIRKIPERLF